MRSSKHASAVIGRGEGGGGRGKKDSLRIGHSLNNCDKTHAIWPYRAARLLIPRFCFTNFINNERCN